MKVNCKNAIESLKANHELFYKDKYITDYWDTFSDYKAKMELGIVHTDYEPDIVESFVEKQKSIFKEALSNLNNMIPFKVKTYTEVFVISW